MDNNLLLVEPEFPYPKKSKNKANNIHKNFTPIGLLKIGAYYKSKDYNVKLVRGNKEKEAIGFIPNEIIITSIFTYWSKYVWESVEHYRNLFPNAKITIGGIYVTLHYNTSDFIEKANKFNVRWHIGLHKEAEKFLPDYSLIEGTIDHHVTHAMRGCIRRCRFCGTWKIEPEIFYKKSDELLYELKAVGKNKVIFFDNNFLSNPQIKKILSDLAELRINNKRVSFESQSGFDGRLLQKDPELATLLKKARFKNVKIAWDNGINGWSNIKKQLDTLIDAGYVPKDISVFMIYNYNIPYEKMLTKIEYCKKWGVQITDCRYRPLDSTSDGFNYYAFRRGQSNNEYHIHKGWTDKKVRDFRKRVRQHNIWIRYAKDKGLEYDINMEKWSSIHRIYKKFNLGKPPYYDDIQNNDILKSRIFKLNSIKNYCVKNNYNLPDLSKIQNAELDNEIDNLYSRFDLNLNKKLSWYFS